MDLHQIYEKYDISWKGISNKQDEQTSTVITIRDKNTNTTREYIVPYSTQELIKDTKLLLEILNELISTFNKV